MEYDKINNLLLSEDNEIEQLSKFVTKEYVRVNSLSNTYNENKSIRFKTPMLRSNLCDYSDAYILVKGKIVVMSPGVNNDVNNIRDKRNRPVILKNNAPFVSCITRNNGELIEDADDLDIVKPMYNLLEYSKNYKKTIGLLYNYYRDELTNDNNDNFANRNVVNSEVFKYKNKITGNTYNVDAGGQFHSDRCTFHTLSIRFSNKGKSAKCISKFMLGRSNQKLFIIQLTCVILALYLD